MAKYSLYVCVWLTWLLFPVQESGGGGIAQNWCSPHPQVMGPGWKKFLLRAEHGSGPTKFSSSPSQLASGRDQRLTNRIDGAWTMLMKMLHFLLGESLPPEFLPISIICPTYVGPAFLYIPQNFMICLWVPSSLWVNHTGPWPASLCLCSVFSSNQSCLPRISSLCLPNSQQAAHNWKTIKCFFETMPCSFYFIYWTNPKDLLQGKPSKYRKCNHEWEREAPCS